MCPVLVCLCAQSAMPARPRLSELQERRWSELQEELLVLISSKLTDDISDYIRFRAVCPSWRRAARLSDHPPQFPWLMIQHSLRSRIRSFCTDINLCNGNSRKRKMVSLELPDPARGKVFLGSSHGWMILLDPIPLLLFLFNPITGDQIHLPPLTKFALRSGYKDLQEGRRSFARLQTLRISWKVSLSSKPNATDCMVVICQSKRDDPNICFCKLGDADWTLLDIPCKVYWLEYHKGQFYVMDLDRKCMLLTKAGCHTATIPPLPLPPYKDEDDGGGGDDDDDYIIPRSCRMVSYKEQLLLVSNYTVCTSYENGSKEEKIYDVYKLEEDPRSRELRWCEVTSIGDAALFMSNYGCFAVCAQDLHGCKQGCIYLSTPHQIYRQLSHEPKRNKHRHVEVFDIKNRSFEEIHGEEFGIEKYGSCFQLSTWFTPSLC